MSDGGIRTTSFVRRRSDAYRLLNLGRVRPCRDTVRRRVLSRERGLSRELRRRASLGTHVGNEDALPGTSRRGTGRSELSARKVVGKRRRLRPRGTGRGGSLVSFERR